MRYCDFHEEQEASAECVNCGKWMCHLCSGVRDGSMLCPNCRGEVSHASQKTQWAMGESPWSTGGFVDETTSRYLKYGFFGAILGIFHSILSGIQLISFVLYPVFLELIIFLGLPTLLLSFIHIFLRGIGFLGLHFKYDDSVCRYVLWFSILYLLIYVIYGVTAVFAAILTPVFIVMVMLLSLSSFLSAVVTAYALWRIKDRSAMPNLNLLLAILGLGGSIIFNFLGTISLAVGNVLFAILFAYFFKVEQSSEVTQEISNW